MLPKKPNLSNTALYFILFLIAFTVVFSSTYNPVNFRRMHVDSSVYVTVAQGITRGYLPYRDFVDNKGPLTYLISAPGLYLGGFTGVWITEIILMFVSVLFAHKTALIFGDRFKALMGTVFSFVILLVFFTVNAGTEEYSLPFLTISFYIFSKYFFSEKREAGFVELIVLGACFASAVMIRLNMFPLWAGFCMAIMAESVKNRRFAQLGKYITGFCLGTVVVFIPVFLYLYQKGIMGAFLGQVIIGGASKGFGSEGIKDIAKNYYTVIGRNFSFFPLFFGLFRMTTNFKQGKFVFYCGYTLSYFLAVLFLSFSSGDNHYNMILIPFFIPALIFLFDIMDSAFHGTRKKAVVIVLFTCIIFSEGLVKYLYDLTKIINDSSGTRLIRAGKLIDDNTKAGDKIISLGFNGYIYPFTQRDAASKYIYQGSGLDYIIGAREEFISDILTEKPAVIALFTAEDEAGQIMRDWHAPILELMEKEYRLLSDENGFRLFIRMDNAA